MDAPLAHYMQTSVTVTASMCSCHTMKEDFMLCRAVQNMGTGVGVIQSLAAFYSAEHAAAVWHKYSSW